MRKFLVLAMAATLLMAGSAFAVDRSFARLTPAPELTFATGQPATTNNNDSCDIGVTPAATLLLPYFEVDTAAAAGTGSTTLFTITNTSRYPQIAHVTLWTDWSFPVLDFNIFLTGYDVQGINLFDVIVRGIVVPGTPAGTSIGTVPGTATGGATGSTPFNNTSNPNFNLGGGSADVRNSCAGLPGTLPADLVAAVKNALTVGAPYVTSTVSCGSAAVGGNHGARAIGYVTIDVASYCSTQLPTDSTYYSGGTAAILYDNTLIGDYQQLGPTPAGSGTAASFDAGGNPLVHIRAIPEGGLSGSTPGTNLPFTFYDRYTATTPGNIDRRQPLPSQWAARYIQGGTAGFATDYKIWREGVTTGSAACNVTQNSALLVTSIVRFDEHENSFGFGSSTNCSPCGPGGVPPLPETSRNSTAGSQFPPLGTADLGGWMYLNLSNNATGSSGTQLPVYTASRVGFGSVAANVPPNRGSRTTSQNWVIISMFGAVGANRLSVDFDAAWLGNGCTPAPAAGTTIAPQAHINPATPLTAGQLICPPPLSPGAGCGTPTQPPVQNP